MKKVILAFVILISNELMAANRVDVKCVGTFYSGDKLTLETCVTQNGQASQLDMACGEDFFNSVKLTLSEKENVLAETLHGSVTRVFNTVYDIPGNRFSISLGNDGEDDTLSISGEASYFGKISLNTGYVNDAPGAKSTKVWNNDLKLGGKSINQTFKNFRCSYRNH
jgi:hypothetical protein